uniref:Uncharacterized protein n=1 Tax=Glossina austeni TaxID=7395 RepID=A0A1A9UD93_GLOAU
MDNCLISPSQRQGQGSEMDVRVGVFEDVVVLLLQTYVENEVYPTLKIMSLKDFPKDKRLRILSAERKQTRYGKSIMLHLEDHVLFLPDKFNGIDDEMLKNLSSGQIDIGKEMIDNEKNYNFNFKRVEQ